LQLKISNCNPKIKSDIITVIAKWTSSSRLSKCSGMTRGHIMKLPNSIFGMTVAVSGSASLKGYPNMYTTAFRWTNITIGDAACLVAEPKALIKPLQIGKMFQSVSSGEGLPCLLVCERLTAYQRTALSDRAVAWLTNEETFHIPFLAASCRPMRATLRKAGNLSAAAQQIALRAIDGSWDGLTSTDVAKKINKSLSSVSSYFAEISAVSPLLIGSRGRTRFICSPATQKDRQSAFAQLEPQLSSPAKQRYFLVCDSAATSLCEKLPKAGISALSEYTMISDDSWSTRAIEAADKEMLKQILDHSYQVAEYDDPDMLLEVWSYRPEERDLLSLCLDVKSIAEYENDDRIEQALSELKGMVFGER
jgi:hypothetical protein